MNFFSLYNSSHYIHQIRSSDHSLSCWILSVENHDERSGKQLSDLERRARLFWVGLAGVDRRPPRGSRLRRRIRRTAVMRWAVGSPPEEEEERNFRQTLKWRLRASSVDVINLFDRTTSSLTASEQRPQTHLPKYLSLILSMYAGVHSSVSPQHSHCANSISICTELVAVDDSWADDTIIPSLIIVADISLLHLIRLDMMFPEAKDREWSNFKRALVSAFAELSWVRLGWKRVLIKNRMVDCCLSFSGPLSFNFLLFTQQELKHQRHYYMSKR